MTTPRALRLIGLALAALLVAPGWAAAQQAGYATRAGMIAIGEGPERPDAELFHVDYLVDGADAPRDAARP